MSVFEALRVALTQLWAHKLKSLFSLIGVVIGITFLIAVITVVEGMNRYVQDDFAGSLFGVNTFSVVRRPTVQTGNRSAEEIRRLNRNPWPDLDDVEAVKKAVPDARYLSYRDARRMSEVWHGERRRRNVRVIGGSEDYQDVQGWKVEEGRGLTPLDQQRGLKVAVIGPEIAEKLFPSGSPLGKADPARGPPLRGGRRLRAEGRTARERVGRRGPHALRDVQPDPEPQAGSRPRDLGQDQQRAGASGGDGCGRGGSAHQPRPPAR